MNEPLVTKTVDGIETTTRPTRDGMSAHAATERTTSRPSKTDNQPHRACAEKFSAHRDRGAAPRFPEVADKACTSTPTNRSPDAEGTTWLDDALHGPDALALEGVVEALVTRAARRFLSSWTLSIFPCHEAPLRYRFSHGQSSGAWCPRKSILPGTWGRFTTAGTSRVPATDDTPKVAEAGPHRDRRVECCLEVAEGVKATLLGERDDRQPPFSETERHEARQFMKVAATRLRGAYARHEQAMVIARQRDLLLSTCHDLKNPLAAMLMGLSSMRRVLTRDAANLPAPLAALAAMERTGVRMNRLVEGLLSVQTTHPSVMLTRTTCFDAVSLLHEMAAQIDPWRHEAGVHIDLDVTETPLVARGDPDRVWQVLTNLVGNAIQATSPGGRIRLGVRSRLHDILFTVEDDGVGISASTRPYLFAPHVRGEAAQYAGHGLGLSIAKHYVEAQGGRIWTQPHRPCGSAFCFTLAPADA